MDNIQAAIHPINPYDGFDHTQYENKVEGWEGNSPIFHEMIDEAQPSLIIEVGTWLGESAINMGLYCKEKGLDTKIICVDTWLGSFEFWAWAKTWETHNLHLKNGYPNIYYHFLANVVYNGLEDIIIPFPVTSITAAKWFRNKNIEADMIYLDADHDHIGRDLALYYPLSKKVFIGHDYHWPNAANAIERYKDKHNLELQVFDNFWRIKKGSVPKN